MNLPKREELLFLTVLAFPIGIKKRKKKKKKKKIAEYFFFLFYL